MNTTQFERLQKQLSRLRLIKKPRAAGSAVRGDQRAALPRRLRRSTARQRSRGQDMQEHQHASQARGKRPTGTS